MTSYSSYTNTLLNLRERSNFRTIPDDAPSALIDLSSNDYLGLASDPSLQSEFMADLANREIPFTSSASRLLAGRQDEYARLEDLLARLYSGGRSALLFNSGYHANTGLISALASEPSTLIVADRLVHASIIDGMVLSKAPFERFAHNSIEHLERILAKNHDKYNNIIVVTESVFSMDGDRSPLTGLIELKKLYPKVLLYVDEAHAFACCGNSGLGLCHDLDSFKDIDVIIGTFGKAAASIGAFAIMPPELRDYAVNRSRSFIFSTSLPPINIAWTRFVVSRLDSMTSRRETLQSLALRLNARLAEAGLPVPDVAGHICPLIVGSSEKALALSAALADEGFKVLPIRTPTVPPGTERLRISLSASLSNDDIDRFASALQRII